MDILLAAILAGNVMAPGIDRDSVDRQAAAETMHVRRTVAPPPRPVAWRASASTLDPASVTTICRAASDHSDPTGFIDRLSHAYGLSPAEHQSLRSSCATSRAARGDAD